MARQLVWSLCSQSPTEKLWSLDARSEGMATSLRLTIHNGVLAFLIHRLLLIMFGGFHG